jgi:CelD/BcsL family acetyltransferase involved in cellulose biosynthesis
LRRWLAADRPLTHGTVAPATIPETRCYRFAVTPTLELEPDCWGGQTEAAPAATAVAPLRTLTAERRPFSSIDQITWDRLAAANPWSTPFSSWAFHRAWWDAYGSSAHEETLVMCDGAQAEPAGIVPLMHRHVVEATDDATRSTIRHGPPVSLTAVDPNCKVVFFGASYHADYATLLAPVDELPAVAQATVAELAAAPSSAGDLPWEVVDLRRLRSGDPAIDALRTAFERVSTGERWPLTLEQEEVCPVLTLERGADFEAYLGRLGKKSRHEIRRKLRRASAIGEIRLTESTDPLTDLGTFIEMHQKRWGDDGLFPPTPGGSASRVFIRRLFELMGDGTIRLMYLTVDERRIAAAIHFETPERLFLYNAGTDPEARDLSPGVLMVAKSIERAIERGIRQFDFMRGAEPYKYDWGAVDEPIQRILVHRTPAQ